MPSLLLIVKNRTNWFLPLPDWVANADVPADLLEFRVKDNKLSVWVVDDNRSNLVPILAAYAANKMQTMEKLDYVLINEQAVADLGIEVTESPGGLPDNGVNGYHRDLIRMSGLKLVALTHAIVQQQNVGRLEDDEVLSSVIAAVSQNRIPSTKLKDGSFKNAVLAAL